MVTQACGAKFIKPDAEASRDVSYNCSVNGAGLVAAGNFSSLNIPNSSGTSRNESDTAFKGVGAYSIGLQYYNDAAKAHPANVSGEPESNFTPRLYWGFIFSLDPGWGGKQGASDPRGLVGMVGNGLGGIMGCETNLSDVVSTGRWEGAWVDGERI